MRKIHYDGFYFLPSDEEEDVLNITFFTLDEEKYRGKPIDGTSLGDMYYIAFFRPNDEGMPVFDDAFEAIFADPVTYIKTLAGSDLYGCLVRKTENSGKWWDVYLTDAKKSCSMNE